MQPSEKDLSKYRLERAKEDIQTAQINIENGLYRMFFWVCFLFKSMLFENK